jgi:ABC-type transport system substrate-binding protein
MLADYYMSTSIGSNRTGYHNAAVDSLLRNALASSSSAAQCSDYAQAQKIIYSDAPALNMYDYAAPEAYRTWLKGVHFAFQGYGPWIPDLRVS